MNTKEIQFDLALPEEAKAFANICLSLNEVGVPYHTTTCGTLASVLIGDGY